MRVARWGNSLAIRLPAALVEALELKAGDDIEIHVADSRELGISRKPGRYSLSIYDAMIAASALRADCDTLLSEDMQDGMVLDDRLRVVNPFRTL